MSASDTPAPITRRLASLLGAAALVSAIASPGGIGSAHAQTADPAVRYMDQVAKELIAASRTRTPAALQSVIMRHADKPSFMAGMTRWMSRYAITEAQKYQVSHVTFQPAARPAKYGLTVDSTVHMRDGSSYDVSWLLGRSGGAFKVRDAQVMSFWMTPQLNRLFSNYINENGGHVRALVVALNR